MTAAVRSDAAGEPALAPLEATLAPVRERLGGTPVNGLHPGLLVRYAPAAALNATAPGWLPATQLTDGTRVPELIYTAQRHWRTEPHVAAALAWKAYAYWLALPAVAGFAMSRRVPLLRPEDVLVQLHDHQPFLSIGLRRPAVAVRAGDPLAAAYPGAVRVLAGEPDLLAALRASLLDAHLLPIVDQFRSRVHLGRRTLLGSISSGIAYGVIRALAGGPSESTVDTIRAMLAALDLDDLVDVSTAPAGTVRVWRRTCCLAFKLPEPKICSGCVIRLGP